LIWQISDFILFIVYAIVCAVVAVVIDGYSSLRNLVLFSVIVAVAAVVCKKTQHTPNPLAQFPDDIPFLSEHSVLE
jgi:apolipoprotein N-acyltransferase